MAPSCESHRYRNSSGLTQQVLLVMIQSGHSLHQLPLLTATFIVHKVPGEDFFQLSDTQCLNVIDTAQVRQRRPATCNLWLLGIPGLNQNKQIQTLVYNTTFPGSLMTKV